MIKLVSYHTWKKVAFGYESAIRCAFVKPGTKWMQVVAIDASARGGLRKWRVPMSDQRFMTPLTRKGKPYPIQRALKIFRHMAKTHGISPGAAKLLREAAREDKTTKEAAKTP